MLLRGQLSPVVLQVNGIYPPKRKLRVSVHCNGGFLLDRIEKGTMLTQKNTFFAFPPSKAQITAADFSKYNKIYAIVDIEANAAIQHNMTRVSNHRNTLLNYANRAIELVKSANVVVPKKFDLEISHHYGWKISKSLALP